MASVTSPGPRLAVIVVVGLVVVALAVSVAGSDGGRPPRPSRAHSGAVRAQPDFLIVSKRGWRTDFGRHTVPLVSFEPGGPPKDGIPAIDRPRFVPVAVAARFLRPREPVIELVIGSTARAYPLQIIVWHEIVNDVVAGTPVVVTYCPLCNTALAFVRRAARRTLAFGATGNLRDFDLVMYDRQTESWWQQFDGRALVGELAGARLTPLAATTVSWIEFARAHPGGTVLSRATGYQRPYGSNPYAGYDSNSTSDCGLLAVLGSAPGCAGGGPLHGIPLKERVVYVERDGQALAIPFSSLRRVRRVHVTVGGEPLMVTWLPGVRSSFPAADDPAGHLVGSARVRDALTGQPVPAATPFWFAVSVFRPGIRIWQPGPSS